MNKLDKLAKKYDADKWGKHHYTPFYYKLLKDRQKSLKKVLEVGVAEGASLRMWRDFFPNAQIYGADIAPKRVTEIYSRTSIIECDQSVERDLSDLIKETGSDIDLFIDDGSHVPDHQVFTCLTLMPLLDKGVIYIIEDVINPSIFNKFNKYESEMHKFGKRSDDRIIIVRHR